MRLSETWFIEGYVDFELQKYRLLGYLQEVHKCFNETKLYPQLSDVIFHYNNLLSFKANKAFLEEQFPRQLDSFNTAKLEFVYKQMLEDDAAMHELENITSYALTQMKGTIDNGAEIYEFVEKQTTMEPIGILPIYKNEGYLLLRQDKNPTINAYAYNVTLFEHKDAKYKGIKLQFVESFTKSIINTFEQIKMHIIHSIRTLPNPAVYGVATTLSLPVNETFLPIAKRMLVRQIDIK